MSKSTCSKFKSSQVPFNLCALQLNLLLLALISNFVFFKVTFHPLIYKSIKILFAMSKL